MQTEMMTETVLDRSSTTRLRDRQKHNHCRWCGCAWRL